MKMMKERFGWIECMLYLLDKFFKQVRKFSGISAYSLIYKKLNLILSKSSFNVKISVFSTFHEQLFKLFLSNICLYILSFSDK